MSCVASIEGICQGRAQHGHHRKRRAQGGSDSYPNVIDVCFACHEHIHQFPLWSRSYGLLVPSWDDPDSIEPVSYACPNRPGPYEVPTT